MSRITPHTYLRIGSSAIAAVIFGLLLLFLTSTPLDPLIQSITLAFYLAAILAMAATLRGHFTNRRHSPDQDHPQQSMLSGDGKSEDTAATRTVDRASPSIYTMHGGRQGQAGIILLTRHDHVTKGIQEKLSDWNLDLDVVNSCAEASQQLLNRIAHCESAARLMLIIDAHDLEMDPIHLPALIKREKALSRVKLVCIVDRVDSTRAQLLLDAGYSALLDTPIDKSQLFAAINSREEQSAANSKVVNLARFRQRIGLQPKRRILLADQHTADRKRIASLLQAAGHRVKSVENGEQALDALERQHFDVALINLQLPIMSGTQVIKLHRFTTPHPQWASFIVMTDQTTPATLRLCRELQVRACLFKPVPTDSLLEMINTAPAVSPPVPATIRHLAETGSRAPETRFLHADLLDTKVLHVLDQLDSESGFVPDLIAIFKRDSVAILEGMEDAVECRDTKRFIELSSILMDNAGQLGAFALYEMCLTLRQISQRELNTTLCTKFTRLDELVARTNQAFEHFLEKREEQRSDRS